MFFGSKQICKRNTTLAYSGGVWAANMSNVRRVLRVVHRWCCAMAAVGRFAVGDTRCIELSVLKVESCGGSRPSDRFASVNSRQQWATVGDRRRQQVTAGDSGWRQATVGASIAKPEDR